MKTITIELDDAGGSTISVDGEEVYSCDNVADCLEYLSDMLQGEEPGEPAAEAAMDDEMMWEEEAAKRPQNPNMMA